MMMDVGLRNALIAKTALRDKNLTRIGFAKTAVEEALQEHINHINAGYRNEKVILSRAIKIYKNLLKQQNTKILLKRFGNFDTMVQFIKKYKRQISPLAYKREIIEAITLSQIGLISIMLKKRMQK